MRKILLFILLLTSFFLSRNSFGQLSYYDSLKAKNILEQLTLREKCAQMVFAHGFAYNASDTSAEIKRLKEIVVKEKIGGILFLTGNVNELPIAINKLQSVSEIPLIIAADFENGVGGRMDYGIEFPPPMAYSATNDTSLAFKSAYAIATEMRSLGVSQNFAPVLDINSNPKNPIINYRSFGNDKQTVVKFGLSFIRGLTKGGVLSTPKHFPGHGSTDLDSHNDLPTINQSLKQLYENDILPFKLAIENNTHALMIAHLNVPALTQDSLPVTLSHKAITEFLKNKLNFNGIIISDAMNMHSITKRYGEKKAIQAAVNAGIDVILFPLDAHNAVDAIYDGVLFNKISESRINESVYKILLEKLRLQLFNNPFANIEKAKRFANRKKEKRLAFSIGEKSITLLRNSDKIIPIKPSEYKNPLLVILRQTDRKDFIAKSRPLASYLKSRINNLKVIELSKLSSKKDFNKALESANKSDLLLIAPFIGVQSFSGEIELTKHFQEFARKAQKVKIPSVLLTFGNPYIISYLPDSKNVLVTYGICPACESAAAKALVGEIDITGILPVDIPTLGFKRGDGLKYKRDFLVFADKEDSLYDFSVVDSLMLNAIDKKIFPGAQLLIAKNGKVILNKPYGYFTYDKLQPVTNNTLYDLASLTKVIATTTAIMILYEKGKISLQDYVVKYLPEFNNNQKDKITIEELLLHTSGLPAGHRFYKKLSTRKEVVKSIMNEKLKNKPGEKFLYSDLGMIVLQLIIEKVSGKSLDKFINDEVFKKLNIKQITFNPPDSLKNKCSPTEIDNYWRMQKIQGNVHDETAALLGGVSGNAGLFSNASDIAIFLQMLLDGGIYKGEKILKPETIELFTTRKKNNRAYGWDTKSPEGYSSAGKYFSLESFGHTGFTGTSIWVDKKRKLFVILLANRVYPTRDNRQHIKFRPVLHDAIINATDN